MAGIVQSPDRLVVWQLDNCYEWFRIEPVEGVISPAERDNLLLTLDATGLPLARYEGELLFLHDGIGGETPVPVILDVVEEMPPMPPSVFNLLEPENGDTLHRDTIQTFMWEESIDPNPDDVVSYRIWFQAQDDSIWFDVQGNSWETRIDSLMFAIGAYFQATWWVKAISGEDTVESNNRFEIFFYPTSAGETDSELPTEFAIQSIYPNPFNSSTTIRYSLPEYADVCLRIYNLRGQEVLTLYEYEKQPGIYTATVSADNLPSGLYFLRLMALDKVQTEKVMLIR